jgi:DNA-binding XRE family transcriptional regulator
MCYVSSLLSVDEYATPPDTSPVPKNARFARQLGLTIRRLRLEAGLSQEELAARAHVHRTFIGLVENGRRDPGIGSVDRVLHALKTDWQRFGAAILESGA